VTTTVHLTDEELADLQQLTNQIDPAEAIRTAMHDFVRYARRIQLKQLSGRVRIQDNWQALEAAELEAQRDANGPGAD
jgi:phage terminase Nu1 subunit (DNA packaging protein)